MSIYVFNKGDDKSVDFVYRSLKNDGMSRFGWSWFDKANLAELKEKPWAEMTEDEILVWSKTKFLLNIKENDWVVHINVPYWGKCVAAQVSGTYFFEENDNEISDFRHCLIINPNSIVEFDRNADEVHPLISRRLKLQSRYWQIYAEKEFFETLENLKNGTKIDKTSNSKEVHYLKEEIIPIFSEITRKVHKTHIGKNLENLVCEIFITNTKV